MIWIYVFIGGGLGSLARFGMANLGQHYFNSHLPIATFLSNLLSCVILACTLYFFEDKLEQIKWLSPFLLIGFCGGFSTFSTFSNETVQLVNNGQWLWAIANIFISVVSAFGIIYWIRGDV